MLKPRHKVLIGMILVAALSRLAPHPPNFVPIGALALFGGAQFADKRVAFLVPLAAMLLSDLAIGFYAHMEWVYGSFALITCVGLWLRSHRTAWGIAGASLTASTLFFRDIAAPGRCGRQMQTWLRTSQGWRVVAAHVSVIEDPDKTP